MCVVFLLLIRPNDSVKFAVVIFWNLYSSVLAGSYIDTKCSAWRNNNVSFVFLLWFYPAQMPFCSFIIPFSSSWSSTHVLVRDRLSFHMSWIIFTHRWSLAHVLKGYNCIYHLILHTRLGNIAVYTKYVCES